MKALSRALTAAVVVVAIAALAAPASANIARSGGPGVVTLSAANTSFVVGSFSITCVTSTISANIPGGTSSLSTAGSNVTFDDCKSTVFGSVVSVTCVPVAGHQWTITAANKAVSGSYSGTITTGEVTCTFAGGLGNISVAQNTVLTTGISWTNATQTLSINNTQVDYTASGLVALAVGSSGVASYTGNYKPTGASPATTILLTDI